jgi:hypothetical protein
MAIPQITAARDDLEEILEALRRGFPHVIVAVRTIQSESGGWSDRDVCTVTPTCG